MKKYLIIFSILACGGCSRQMASVPSEEAIEGNITFQQSENFRVELNEDYQQFSPQVQFKLEADGQLNVMSQRSFIQSSGLPLESGFAAFAETTGKVAAFGLYRDFIERQVGHAYLNTFRQYGGWLLITHFSMLNDSTSECAAMVRYMTEQLITSEYKGFGLLYCCIAYLQKHQAIEQSDLQSMSVRIENYADPIDPNDPPKILKPEDIKSGGRTVNPEVIAMMNKGLEERRNQAVYISKIRHWQSE